MFEHITPESIKAAILEQIGSGIDKREGSFVNDMIAPTAYELWKLYDTMNALVPMVYIDETSGEYIDKRCADFGIYRKPGQKATVTLKLDGTNGANVPKGTVFLTNDGIMFETDADVSILDSETYVTATAVEAGEVSNVDADTISVQYKSIIGVNAVTNDEPATGGKEPESDVSLVERYYAYRRRPATSGNKYDYENWAMSVEGVGGAKAIPLAYGEGTVGILIMGDDMEPVGADIINACAEYIESVRPIGASVYVESVQKLPIAVTATVTLASGYSMPGVQSEFETRLTAFCKSAAFKQYAISYNQITYMLMGIDGVQDFANLTLNGGTSNLTLTAKQVPVLETVVLN